jgi:TolA-binding protein
LGGSGKVSDDDEHAVASTLEPELPGAARPRSPAAAAFLNLSGLSAGYAYLRRGWHGWLYAYGTALLVVLAFATGAAAHPWPWRIVAIVWLLWMAIDGFRLARRTGPKRLASRKRALHTAVGVVLVAAVVAGYLFYVDVGRRVHADGVAAQGRGDCVAATSAFDALTGPFELTLTPDVADAATKRTECAEYLAATKKQETKAFAEAVQLFKNHKAAHPTSLLTPFVQESLLATYEEWAGEQRSAGNFPEAEQVYRELIDVAQGVRREKARADLADTYIAEAEDQRGRLAAGDTAVNRARTGMIALLTVHKELGDTAPAQRVPQAMTDLFAAARGDVAKQRWCQAIPMLDYFVTLSDAETNGIVPAAHGDRVQSLLECGLDRFRGIAYDEAKAQLDKLVAAYPNSPQAAQARSASISAEVGTELNGPLAVPAPDTGPSPGPISVTFYNDSPAEIRALVAGQTAHEMVIPGCAGCPASYPAGAKACPTFAGRASVTLHLRPGRYDMLVEGTDGSLRRLVNPIEPRAGFIHTSCLYVRQW